MEDNFDFTPKAVYGKDGFKKALVDGPAGLGASLRLTSPRMGSRTCPPWPPSHLDKVFEYMALMKRVQEDDASANKRKKKGDYVDDNDEEEDLLVICFSHIEGADDGHSQICWDLRNRLPPFNGNQEQFWARQPQVRLPLRESYND